jgi:hypothetical protein
MGQERVMSDQITSTDVVTILKAYEAQINELRAELAAAKAELQAMHRPPFQITGTGSMSLAHCGCWSFSQDGKPESRTEFKCPAHRDSAVKGKSHE